MKQVTIIQVSDGLGSFSWGTTRESPSEAMSRLTLEGWLVTRQDGWIKILGRAMSPKKTAANQQA